MKMRLATVFLALAIPSAAFAQALDLEASPNPSGMLASQDPTVRFDMTEHDFGAILNVDSPKVKFKFFNDGGGTLIFRNIHASCGCTVPNLDSQKREYGPGESGNLEVEFHPKGKSGRSHTSVSLNTNDPEHPNITLNIYADVHPVVKIEPPLVQFADVKKGEARTVEVRVLGRKPDFQATGVVIQSADETVVGKVLETEEVEVQGEKLRSTRISFNLKPDAKAGNIYATATITTNDPREEKVPVQIMGRINGDLEASPPVVSLGMLAPGQQFSKQFRVSSRTKAPFKLSKAEGAAFQGMGVTVTYEITPVDKLIDPVVGLPAVPAADQSKRDANLTNPADKPWSYLVTISGVAPNAQGMVSGDIKLTTDVKAEELMTVKFTGAVRAAPAAGGQPQQPGVVRPTPTVPPSQPSPVVPQPAGPGGK